MKTFFLILTSLLVLTACTVPAPSDFESADKSLTDDEFIVAWRFSRLAKDPEVLDKSPEHKIEMEAAMAPLFEQLIPQIFSDLKEGKLLIREEDDITDLDENPIKNLPALMELYYETSWQNFKPFTEVFHITQRRNVFTAGFPAVELEIELLAQDPNGKYHESGLGSVRVDDLIKLGYFIEVEGQKYDLIDYLNKTIRFGYPIGYFYQNYETGLRTLEEAFGSKEYILEGKWVSIPWLAGEVNLTGLDMITKSKSELDEFAGEYHFSNDLSETETKEASKGIIKVSSFIPSPTVAHFCPHEKYVYFQWTYEGKPLNFFPMANESFFATSGELMKFEKTEEGEMQMSFTDAKGKEIRGYRD